MVIYRGPRYSLVSVYALVLVRHAREEGEEEEERGAGSTTNISSRGVLSSFNRQIKKESKKKAD